MKKLKLILTISLIPMIILINSIETGNRFIEKYYSNFLYQYISEKMRFLIGWINLPIGDILFNIDILFYLFCFL